MGESGGISWSSWLQWGANLFIVVVGAGLKYLHGSISEIRKTQVEIDSKIELIETRQIMAMESLSREIKEVSRRTDEALVKMDSHTGYIIDIHKMLSARRDG